MSLAQRRSAVVRDGPALLDGQFILLHGSSPGVRCAASTKTPRAPPHIGVAVAEVRPCSRHRDRLAGGTGCQPSHDRAGGDRRSRALGGGPPFATVLPRAPSLIRLACTVCFLACALMLTIQSQSDILKSTPLTAALPGPPEPPRQGARKGPHGGSAWQARGAGVPPLPHAPSLLPVPHSSRSSLALALFFVNLFLWRQGYGSARLCTSSGRPAAVGLYLAAGFEPKLVGEQDRGAWSQLCAQHRRSPVDATALARLPALRVLYAAAEAHIGSQCAALSAAATSVGPSDT